MSKQLNFNNQRDLLTEADTDQLVVIIGSRCQEATKRRLKSMIAYGRKTIPNYGIFERLIKESGKWSYCAGQSYPDEIRTIRNLILRGE